MADKSGVSESVLTLPKGGGSLKGIGETFVANPQMGTGKMTVPIELPQGRGALRPSLDLHYSTGAGNGPFGLGWSISVPGITRRTAKGVPRYRDLSHHAAERDVFVLSGGEELTFVGETQGQVGGVWELRRRYRPATEGLFARIEHVVGPGRSWWEIATRDGLRSVYGEDASACVMHAGDPARVFAWQLTSTRDPFGNIVRYEYRTDDGRDTAGVTLSARGHELEQRHAYNQSYLARVLWGDYRPRGAAQEEFLYAVELDYGGFDDDGYAQGDWDYRDDPFSGYRAGFEIRTARRCKRLLVKLKEQGDQDFDLLREYLLAYTPARGNGVALLTSVELRGHAPKRPSDVAGTTLADGTLVTARHRVQRFPPLTLSYEAFDAGRRRLIDFVAPGGALPERGLADPEFELADLDGQGLPGVLATGRDGHRYWRNLGDGRLQGPRSLTRAPAGVSLADPGVQLADMQGDGRIDLVVSNGRVQGYYPSTFDGGWDERSFQPAARSPALSLADPDVKLVDMDGDGVTDLLYSGERDFQIHYNRGAAGWAGETEHVPRRPLEEFPDVRLGDPDGHAKIAEMTGDGCSDIALVRDGRVDYWPHMGHGRYGKRVTMRGTPRIGYAFDARRVLIADVDGDGYGDFVYVGYDTVTVCLNRSGNEWSAPVTVAGTPLTPEPDAVRPVDMLGAGTPGLLWSVPNEQAPGRNYVFLDFNGGLKPYLLRSIANGLGARTSIQYEPSTSFFVRDMKAELPWATKLPFPVSCVSRVELSDEISGGRVVSEYRYHHGCWDGVDREFRGFARVDQWDAHLRRAGGGPDPVEVRTWYSVGPDELGNEPDLRREYWDGDPPQLARPKETRDLFARLAPPARRLALRTMRSQVLRAELYGRDGSAREDRPFTVTEYVTALREEEPGAVFFPHQVGQRVTQWERGDDPQTEITALGRHDDYGLVRAQLRLGVPRGRDPRVAAAPGEPYLTLLTETDYAQRDDADHYIVDRAAGLTLSELPNDGSVAARDLIASALDGTAARELVSQSLSFYDGDAYDGLPYGELGDYGAVVRQEALAFTEDLLIDAYGTSPPYLRSGAVAWPAEYPDAFRSALAGHAGYVRRGAAAGSPYLDGWYVRNERRRYDFHSPSEPTRGLVRARRDPLGRITRIRYDGYGLLPVSVTDPIGLVTALEQDYRVGRISRLRDPNGNRKRIRFTPLGLVSEVYVTGKRGEGAGDPAGAPSTRYRYDLLAFAERGEPVSITTESRFRYASDTSAPAAERGRRRVVAEYSDGFGRLLQTRSRAADLAYGELPSGEGVLPGDPAAADNGARAAAPAAGGKQRVRVSGATVFDDKGRPVERYETYLGLGFQYAEPGAEDLGRRITVEYDVRGHALRTATPDGAQQRTVYGVPVQLDDPDDFEPTPWEAYSYDANDNAGRTHPATSAGYSAHWDTPSSLTINAWGRTVERVQRIGSDPVSERFANATAYDTRGNPVEARDALGRVVARTLYDYLGRALRAELLDGGVRTTLADASGEPLESRDGRGALTLNSYDDAGRPRGVWERDRTAGRICLREWREYGDELPRATARPANLLGRPYRAYDGAGVVTYPAYDFAAQNVASRRRFVDDSVLLASFDPNDWTPVSLELDWTPPAGGDIASHAASLLEQDEHEVDWVHDALGQLVSVTFPLDAADHRAVLSTRYDEAGALSSLELDGRTLVERVYQDAGGRRTLVAYGNGVMTRHAYDELTGRLVRTRSETFDRTGDDLLPTAPATTLQDLVYDHDLTGNVTAIRDLSPRSGVTGGQDAGADAALAALLASGDALVRRFGYDPLYRLASTSGGRICSGLTEPPPWTDYDRCGLANAADPSGNQVGAPDGTALYDDAYGYDPAGNLGSLTRTTPAGSWTRRFGVGGLAPAAWRAAWQARLGVANDWADPPGNHLTHVSEPGGPAGPTHAYDTTGNLVHEVPDAALEWDAAGRLTAHRRQGRSGAGEWLEPEGCVLHLYDGSGRRAKTLVRREGGDVESSAEVDGLFERHKSTRGGASETADALFVLDGGRPLAVSRVGGPAGVPELTLELGDHLGSSTLSLDLDGAWNNREEFTPFGETSYGGYKGKRHRFTGVRRDTDSGLAYHGARWYSPWLGRFVSCDPAGFAGGANLYGYAGSNPVTSVDRTGTVPAAYEIADAWEASPIASGATSLIPGVTGESVAQAISSGAEKLFNQDIDNLPQGDGFFVSAYRNSVIAVAAVEKSVIDVVGGMVAGAVDPGFAVRGIMRIGVGAASGVDDISRGNTALGASKIIGDVSQSILVVAGAAKFGAPKAPPTVGPTGRIAMWLEKTGAPVDHLKIGIQLDKGPMRVFEHMPRGAEKAAGGVVVKGLGMVRELESAPSKAPNVKTVPLAEAEAALRAAQEKVQAPGANPKYGPGTTNFNILTDNCTTFAAEIASKGGVMTPATFPTLTWHFFDANLSGANMATGAAVMLGAGAAGQQKQNSGQ